MYKGRVTKMSEFYNSLNKYAFQWDAYRPLVDRIPAGTVQRGGLPRVCLPPGGVCLGVFARGVSLLKVQKLRDQSALSKK